MAKPIILEGYGRTEVLLAAAVKVGDLLGYSLGWVKADADATVPVPARLVAATAGASGETITAFKLAIVDDQDASLTVDQALYLSGTAGGYTATAPAAAGSLGQVVGRALGPKRYELDLGARGRFVRRTLTIPAALPSGTSGGDILTSYVPGFKGTIEGWAFVAAVPATGAGATQTFNLEVGTTDVDGTATAVVLADANAAGKVKALVAPTAGHASAHFDADDALSIEFATGGTAFTAGSGAFLITCREEVAAS